MAKAMKQALFGTSGIRGVVNVDVTPMLALNVGLAVATHTGSGDVAVGRDTRTSGPMLERALVSGLLAGGSAVRRLGLTPTPALAFLTRELKADAGIMVTASHNPPEYNGFKLFQGDSMAYSEEQQDRIEEVIRGGLYRRSPWQGIGKVTDADEAHRYLEFVEGAVKLRRRWRVVLDPGCGATCHTAPAVFQALGCEVTAINAQPDGLFPGRSPLPEGEALEPLCRAVRAVHADLGFAYDGDGDRVSVVDEMGEPVPFDRALAAFAAHVVEGSGGGTVVTHVEASMCLERAVEPRGGRVVRTRVGDVSVAAAVREHGAVFGGEPCGAWIHPRHHLCPDGVLSSVLLLGALEEEDKSLSSLISEVPSYPILRATVACPDGAKSKVMEGLEGSASSLFSGVKERLTVDGLRLTLEDGWILVRPSGTEPVVRLTVEADTTEEVKRLMDRGVKWVKKEVKEVTG